MSISGVINKGSNVIWNGVQPIFKKGVATLQSGEKFSGVYKGTFEKSGKPFTMVFKDGLVHSSSYIDSEGRPVIKNYQRIFPSEVEKLKEPDLLDVISIRTLTGGTSSQQVLERNKQGKPRIFFTDYNIKGQAKNGILFRYDKKGDLRVAANADNTFGYATYKKGGRKINTANGTSRMWYPNGQLSYLNSDKETLLYDKKGNIACEIKDGEKMMFHPAKALKALISTAINVRKG